MILNILHKIMITKDDIIDWVNTYDECPMTCGPITLKDEHLEEFISLFDKKDIDIILERNTYISKYPKYDSVIPKIEDIDIFFFSTSSNDFDIGIDCKIIENYTFILNKYKYKNRYKISKKKKKSNTKWKEKEKEILERINKGENILEIIKIVNDKN